MSATSVFLAGKFLFVRSDTNAFVSVNCFSDHNELIALKTEIAQ